MMTYLIDTHILLWALNEPEKLSNHHRKLIEDKNNTIVVSSFSYIEIAIKQKLGKIDDCDLNALSEYALTKEFTNLDITIRHIELYKELPLMPEHRDPFDRFIISTAIAENMKLITVDPKFQFYKNLLDIIFQ